jgi:hypothetical protein
MSACASRCRFRASGVDGAGMARSSVAAVMSLWLARGGDEPLAVRQLVVGGGAGVPDRRGMAARTGLARRRVGGGGNVLRRGATQTNGESRSQN